MPFELRLTTADRTETHRLVVPTKWADVTLATFVAAFAPVPDDTRTMAEVLCGLAAGTLDRLAVRDVDYLANLLNFALDPAPVMALLPTPDLPDIGTLPYGTLLLANQYLEQHPDRPQLAYGPYLLALYRVQLVHGKYDEAKVAACLQALLDAPVTESYGDAAFFLASYNSWLSGTPPTPTTPASPKTKNWRREAKSWRRDSGRFSAWMRRLAAP